MSKRKTSADRNVREKPTSRRTSAASLSAKNNNVTPQRRLPPEKSSSIQNLRETDQENSSKTINKAVEACLPKTRFSSQDRYKEPRSNSSPRLKSFPAEKLKKLDNPPYFSPEPMAALITQQDPREKGTLFLASPSNQCQNNGQGDTTVVGETVCQHRQQPQNVGCASQQQVAPHQSFHQAGRMNPNSESMLVQQTTSPNSQVHRPFVPNIPHGVVARNYSPGRIDAPISVSGMPSNMQNFPATTETTLTPGISQKHIEQRRNNIETITGQGIVQRQNVNSDKSIPDYDKQPGRNSTVHRRTMIQNQQQIEPQTEIPPGVHTWNQRSNDNRFIFPHVQGNVYSPHAHISSYASHQNPQQAYQQLQQNIANQQQMQQRAMNHQLQMMTAEKQAQQHIPGSRDYYYNYYTPQLLGNYFPGHGMTSPQDLTINHLKNLRNLSGHTQQGYPMDQRNIEYRMNPQNRWSPNEHVTHDKPGANVQLKPFTADLVNSTNNETQYTSHSQQQGAYQASQHHQQRGSMMHQQLYNNSSQNYPNTGQETSFPQQTTKQSYPIAESRVHGMENANKRNVKKRCLQFTPEMIRDQEFLVSTMRQQGISDDIMRRQFDALLNEQRKHLLYIEQTRQQEELPEERRVEVHVRGRKQIDEKPEWMVHITPPRMSYTDLERLRVSRNSEEKKARNEQCDEEKINETSNENKPVQMSLHNQQTPYGFYQHVHNLPQQVNVQTPGYINTSYPPYRGNQDIMKARNNTNHVSWPCGQMTTPQQQYYQHPQNVPYFQYGPYQQGYNSAVRYPEMYQTSDIHKDANTNINSSAQQNVENSCENNSRTDEPCSLFKMRLYKEIIRPQKCNNGLQDSAVIQKALKELKNSENKKGMEYLANLTKKKIPVKLNGIQEHDDMHPDLLPRPATAASSLQAQRRISANGLENNRNPDNPPQRRLSNLKRSEHDLMLTEYPRQRQTNPRYCYSVQAERENNPSTIPQQQSLQNQQVAFSQPEFNRYDKSHATFCNQKNPGNTQCYRQMQRCCNDVHNFVRKNGEGDVSSGQRADVFGKSNPNRAGGDACEVFTLNDNRKECLQTNVPHPFYGDTSQKMNSQAEIQEARTIGGITYLARKPDYVLNNQIISPESLISSKHLQPPSFY